MDLQPLIQDVEKFIASVEAEGKPFNFVALVPFYGGLINSFVIQVSADWIDPRNRIESLIWLSDKLYATTPTETIRHINHIGTYKEKTGLHYLNDPLILRNTLERKLPYPYQLLYQYSEEE